MDKYKGFVLPDMENEVPDAHMTPEERRKALAGLLKLFDEKQAAKEKAKQNTKEP